MPANGRWDLIRRLKVKYVWTPVDGEWEICVVKVQKGLTKFPWKHKTEKDKEHFEDSMKA